MHSHSMAWQEKLIYIVIIFILLICSAAFIYIKIRAAASSDAGTIDWARGVGGASFIDMSKKDSSKQTELIDNKPVIRVFSTTNCPHCRWVKNDLDSVLKEYINRDKIIAYHWTLDTGDNTLTQEIETRVPKHDLEIFKGYNPEGTVPTFVFGKYMRIGTYYEKQNNHAAESAEFRAVIEKLLNEAETLISN